MMRLALAIASLTLVYCLELGSFNPWDLLLGALLASLLLARYRRFVFVGEARPAADWPRRLVAFGPFTLAVLRDILAGTWQVSLFVLGLRPNARPGFVEVQIGDRSRLGVAVASLVTTLSPGSVLVDIDWERGTMLFHAIDASDPEKIRAGHEDFYRRYQRAVFP